MTRHLLPALVLSFSLACSFLSSPPPTPTGPAIGEATPTARPLPTAQPIQPTDVPPVEPATPAPAASTPAPSNAPLSQTGPWLIIHAGEHGLWAANPDGAGLTQLVNVRIISPPYSIRAALSPDGRHVAFVTAADPSTYQGLALNLLTLPEGTVESITPLFKPDVVPFTGDNFGSDTFEAARSIADYDSMAWSPDGTRLAFIGAQDGPSSDLYVYHLADGRIERLTDGPSQAYGLSWSPDGKYIVHAGVSSFGTGAGYGLVGMWAAAADGSGVKPLQISLGADVKVVGWIANNVFLVHGWSVMCGENNLRFYDLLTGAETTLSPGCFGSLAFDPLSRALAFVAIPDDANTQPGLYIVPPESLEPIFVTQSAVLVEWSPRFGQFHVYTDGPATAYSPGGSPTPFLAEEINGLPGGVQIGAKAWLPDGQTLAFIADGGLYVASASDMIAIPVVGVPLIQSIGWLAPLP